LKISLKMMLIVISVLGLVFVLAGCGGDEQAETSDTQTLKEEMTDAAEALDSDEVAEAVEEMVSELSAEQQKVVDKAVAIAKAVQAAPLKADAVMTEYGMTTESFDEMMAEISADPAMSMSYTTQLLKQ